MMKCPNCGIEMDAGFLQSSIDADIVWVSRALPMGLGRWKSDSQLVSEETVFGTNTIPTHICRRCKLLVGSYGQEE